MTLNYSADYFVHFKGWCKFVRCYYYEFMPNVSHAAPQYFILQTGSEEPSVPIVPGGRNVSLSSDLGHVADGESNGAVEDWIQRSAALDEGRISGAGSRHTQTDGEIPQGQSHRWVFLNRKAPITKFYLLSVKWNVARSKMKTPSPKIRVVFCTQHRNTLE